MGNSSSNQAAADFFTGSNGNHVADSLVSPLVNAIQQDQGLKSVISTIAPTSQAS